MHKIITILCIFILTIFCSLWQNVQIIKTGKLISQKEKLLKDLKFKNRVLELKVANLKSLDRIEDISKDKLGLNRASEYRVVYLKNNISKTKVAKVKETSKGNKNSLVFRMLDEFMATAEAAE